MKILLCVLMLYISGCTTQPKHNEVLIPVATKIVVPTLVRPKLAITNLTEEEKQDNGKFAQAYAASFIQTIYYVRELEAAIKFIKTQTADTKE